MRATLRSLAKLRQTRSAPFFLRAGARSLCGCQLSLQCGVGLMQSRGFGVPAGANNACQNGISSSGIPTSGAAGTSGASFERFRDKTITDRAAFLAELATVKAQGYGEDREEFDDHIRCLGVPIFDRLGQPIAGLSVSFPTFRYDDAKAPEVVAMLQAASRDISTRLGCSRFPLDEKA